MRTSKPLESIEEVGRNLEARCLRAVGALRELMELLDDWRKEPLPFDVAVDPVSWRVEYSANWTELIPPSFPVIVDEIVHHCRLVAENANVYRGRWTRSNPGEAPTWDHAAESGVMEQLRHLDNYSKHERMPLLALAVQGAPVVIGVREGRILGELPATLTDVPIADGRVFAVLERLPPEWQAPGTNAGLLQRCELVFGPGIHSTLDLAPVMRTLAEGLRAMLKLTTALSPSVVFP